MKKKLLDRRGAGVELAILMLVICFSLSILLTSTAAMHYEKKLRATSRLQQSVFLEQVGQDFLTDVINGRVDELWMPQENVGNTLSTVIGFANVHIWEETIDQQATCLEDGKKTLTCSVCGEVREEVIPAAHAYAESQVIAATCTQDGKKVFTCTRQGCGHSYEEAIPAAHKWEQTAKVEATCTENGKKIFTCTGEGCEDSYEEVIPAAHKWVQTAKVEATCTKEGSVTYSCSCGIAPKVETIPKADHDYERVTTKEASCEEEGTESLTCKDCGHEATAVIPITHTWGENRKCVSCGAWEPMTPVWEAGYSMVVFKTAEHSFRSFVVIIEDVSQFCATGSALDTNAGGEKVLTIRLEKEVAEDGSASYKITEWTKNDRS